MKLNELNDTLIELKNADVMYVARKLAIWQEIYELEVRTYSTFHLLTELENLIRVIDNNREHIRELKKEQARKIKIEKFKNRFIKK